MFVFCLPQFSYVLTNYIIHFFIFKYLNIKKKSINYLNKLLKNTKNSKKKFKF